MNAHLLQQRLSRALGVCSVVAVLCGCDVGYYAHVARGQAHLIMAARPIEEVLSAGVLDSLRRGRLELTQQIRRFGTAQLGLQPTRSYTLYYDTARKPISWNVSASPRDRFDAYLWSFPVAGTVPYKGFFLRRLAEEERARLAERGLDVHLRPVSAYSTLGYFPDPVLSTMLEYSPDVLADLILHELTHGTVYLKGQTSFNESLATYVGREGSLRFLADHFGSDSPWIARAQMRRRDVARFREFMFGVVGTLDSLYSAAADSQTAVSQRELLFAASKERYRATRDTYELLNYDDFLEWPINNARLLSYRRYNTDLAMFDSLCQMPGGSLAAVIQSASDCAEAADPWSCMREPLGRSATTP
jgi:predicted aminopeptidase